MENNKKIEISQEQYNNLVKSINQLRDKLSQLNGKDFDHDSTSISGRTIEKNLIEQEIALKKEAVRRSIVVEHKLDAEVIDIGDLVKVLLSYAEDDQEEMQFTLVAASGNGTSEISINSALGEAIYHHRVGEKTSFKAVDNQKIFVQILAKELIANSSLKH